MNFADIEKTINQLGEKVWFVLRYLIHESIKLQSVSDINLLFFFLLGP